MLHGILIIPLATDCTLTAQPDRRESEKTNHALRAKIFE